MLGEGNKVLRSRLTMRCSPEEIGLTRCHLFQIDTTRQAVEDLLDLLPLHINLFPCPTRIQSGGRARARAHEAPSEPCESTSRV